MTTLQSTSNGCVLINGVPYQRGTLDVDKDLYRNERLKAWVRRNGPSNPVVNNLLYGDIEIDGISAASWEEVDAFVQSNFFFEVGEGGGGGGDTIINYNNNWASTNW